MKAKGIILALAVLLAAVLPAAAETHYRPHISIGARAGASLGQMSFSPSVKQLWNPGTTGAVTFRYTEEKLFALIAEFGWVQRGWQENYELLPFDYHRTLTYLNLPLLTHIYFGSRRVKGFVNLGPQIAYMLSETTKANFDYRNPYTVPDYPAAKRQTEQLYTPVKNRFDYGICAGAGMEFYLSPRNSISLEGRFYFGLGNIFPAAKADTFSASRAMSIEVSLGYFFRLK